MKQDLKRAIFIGTYLAMFQIAFIILMSFFASYKYNKTNLDENDVPKLYASEFLTIREYNLIIYK